MGLPITGVGTAGHPSQCIVEAREQVRQVRGARADKVLHQLNEALRQLTALGWDVDRLDEYVAAEQVRWGNEPPAWWRRKHPEAAGATHEEQGRGGAS